MIHHFVALGDSFTEGVGDPVKGIPLRSTHDWLADWMRAASPNMRYTNLATRGLRAAEIRSQQMVALSLSWRTRNYVGTIFGGSLYGAIDPIYMLMLIHTLGPGFIVWDKAATIRFRKPGRSTLYARFVFTDEELQTIRTLAAQHPSVERVNPVELADKAGVVHASFEKTLYIRKKPENQSKKLEPSIKESR